MNLVQTLNIDQSLLSQTVKQLADDYLFSELTLNNQEDYHRSLLKIYQSELKKDNHTSIQHELLNVVLRSGIRCGDFLNLSSFIYKADKEIKAYPEKYSPAFLASYYESCALYHFYDNNPSEAIKSIEWVLASPHISHITLERCFYYYASMLLAGYLPLQARDVIIRYKKQHPALAYNPLMGVMDIIIAIENHVDRADIDILLTSFPIIYEQTVENAHLFEAHALLHLFVEAKTVVPKNIQLFPPNWEQTLRVDLWLKAKMENKFYYHLILDGWQERKKVF
jgi:hypothetical protein